MERTGHRKKIAITMGDPAGIGPETILRALVSGKLSGEVLPVIVGSRVVMEEAAELLGADIRFSDPGPVVSADPPEGTLYLVDVGVTGDIPRGRPSPEGGRASVSCIEKALRMCLAGDVHAMVTAPISKEAIHLAGYRWPGHTEMLAELTGTEKVAMMFAGEKMKVILVTIHAPLRTAIGMINMELVLDTIRMAERGCTMFGISTPRIAVAGLNPHAGEGGLFGNEEQEHIAPAIEAARGEGMAVEGPFPPDVVFHRILSGEYDIVVAMYHDQGLIPFKLLCFERGVNVTVGLPVIRTSPDHGTAYDIAWQGRADPSSLIEAIRVAERIGL